MNISVIIPVYNAERFLKKAVDSALQFDEVKEVLLIEDASPDHSLEVCKKLLEKDQRIKLLQHPDKGNHGAGATRNLGLKYATQEFIAFLDADDYYLPNRFEAEKELFKDKKIEGVFGALGTEFITEKGKIEFQEKFKHTELTTVKHEAEGKDVFYGLLGLDNTFGTFFHLNTLTIRNNALQREKLTFNEKLKVHQDQDFIIKLAFHCYLKTGNITKPVAIRGVHDDNRITKIALYSQEYNQKQFLLWQSLHQWSKNLDIEKAYKDYIRKKYKSFLLAKKKGLKKAFSILKEWIKDPQLLKTRYRFTYLKR